jgi:hypothetical protein
VSGPPLACPNADNDLCTDEVCNTTTGTCDTGPRRTCPNTDNDLCTDETCNATTGACDTGARRTCPDDNNVCTTESCNSATGACDSSTITCPPDDDPCTVEVCDPVDGCVSQPTGNGFPFLVKDIGKFGNNAEINGSVGANDPGGTITIGKGAFVSNGSVVAGDGVRLGANTSVFDVLANDLVTGPGVTIRNSQGTPTLPLTDPFCVIPSITCDPGAPDVIVFGSAPPLPPGSYNRIRVTSGELVLQPGTFTACSVHAARGTRITITGVTPTTINVEQSFRLSNAGILAPTGGAPTPRLNVAGLLMRIGAASVLQASVFAPNATLRLGRSSQLIGSFCVANTTSDKSILITCPTVP